MARTLSLDWRGLYSYPNPFSKVPDGAMRIADNVNINSPGVVTTRRGVNRYGDSLGPVSILSLIPFQQRLVVHDDSDTLSYDSDGLGTWTAYSGSYAVPDAADPSSRVRAASATKSLFVTTANGIYSLDSITGTPRLAGAPQGLSGLGIAGLAGWMPDNTNVAYRILWGYVDTNDVLIRGAPSSRILVTNTSGIAADVDLTLLIPAEIDTTWFFQVYRGNVSAAVADEPDDEMQLVYQANPTAGEIIAGEISFTDSTPADLRQESLYTNITQEGIEQANDRPPFAKDIAEFKNYTFYANTRQPHFFEFKLVVVGAPGIDIGDEITFTRTGGSPTFTLTGAALEDAAAGEFLVFTGGTASENIEATARSIERVVNNYAANTFLDCYYVSGFEDLPGALLFEERSLVDTSFFVNCDVPTALSPQLPIAGSTTENTSENDTSPNRLYYSKFQQPSAVPYLNYVDAGSADKPIRKILASRDTLFILKDDGIWLLTGTEPPWTISQLAPSTTCLATNSAVILDNQVFFFSEQGIVAASNTGVGIASQPIEGELLQLSSSQFPNFDDFTFAIAYESDRKYMLNTITRSDDESATQIFVYNTLTQAWTKWTRGFTCGTVNPANNKLYFGTKNDTDAYVYQERKNYSDTDFADESFDVTIVSATGTLVTLVDTTGIEAGMSLLQGVTVGVIEEVVDGTDIIVARDVVWTAGAAEVYTPIACRAKTNQIDAREPTTMKHYREILLLFGIAGFQNMNLVFESDLSGSPYSVPIEAVSSGGWGLFEWGGIPWGGVFAASESIRTYVPEQVQRCNWFFVTIELEEAFRSFSLNGISAVFEVMSTHRH